MTTREGADAATLAGLVALEAEDHRLMPPGPMPRC